MRRRLLGLLLAMAAQGCVNLAPPTKRPCAADNCVDLLSDAAAEPSVDAPKADAIFSSGQPLGSACARADQCASNVCADGVCCATSCAGTCMSCNVKGNVGVCVPVPAGSDPDDECAAEDSKSCGRDGACDGMG